MKITLKNFRCYENETFDFGENGITDSTPRSVLSTCKGEDIMYEVIPTKGRPYIVNSKHILTLKGNRPCYNFRKNRNK